MDLFLILQDNLDNNFQKNCSKIDRLSSMLIRTPKSTAFFISCIEKQLGVNIIFFGWNPYFNPSSTFQFL
ncbi:hypothetical protein [Blattabacterium punctulatus]|uniref:hypothetical protein n=1 Tax=Blattabacterium punctulatus TaxID=164514 RepID=UPI00374447BD